MLDNVSGQGLSDQDREPRKNGKEREKVEVRVAVQPPDFFEQNKPYDAIVATENFVVGRAPFPESLQYADYDVFNSTGKRVKVAKLPPFTLSSSSFIPWIDQIRSNYGYVYTTPGGQNSLERLVVEGMKLDTSFGLGKRIFDQLIALADTAGAGTVDAERVKRQFRKNEALVGLSDAALSVDQSGRWLTFQHGKKLVVFETQNEEGGVLPPEKWQCYQYATHEIDDAQLKERPWLRLYAEAGRGIQLEGIPAAVECARGVVNIISTDTGKRLFSDQALSMVIDPNESQQIHYLSSSGEIKSINVQESLSGNIQVETRSLPVLGAVKEMTMDHRGNFFLVVVEADGQSTLAILEKDTLAMAGLVPDVSSNIHVDRSGGIYYLDQQHRLRLANTNLATFERGGLEKAREAKRQALLAKQQRLSQGIELPEVGIRPLDSFITEDDIVSDLGKQLEAKVLPLLEGVSDLAELDELRGRVAALKQDPEWVEHPEIFLGVEAALDTLESKLKVVDFERELITALEAAEDADGIRGLVALEQQVNTLRQLRRGFGIANRADRERIDGALNGLSAKLIDLRAKLTLNIRSELDQTLGAIKDLVQSATSPHDLSLIDQQPEHQNLDGLLSLLPREQQRGYREQYRELVRVRGEELRTLAEAEKEAERYRQAELFEEARQLLADIAVSLDEDIARADQLPLWAGRSGVVTRFRAKIIELPDALRRDLEQELVQLMKRKERDFEHREVLNIPKSGGEVQFGSQSFPIFHQPEVVWRPRIVPISRGSSFGNLVFEDNLYRLFDPGIGSIPIDFNDPTTRSTIELFSEDAKHHFESLRRKVPEFSDTWVMTDFTKQKLEKIAKRLQTQLKHQRGILILEGEAGTGKNVLIDMFAHFTNRETFTFSCNFQTEKEDITYAFRFEPGKGTYTVDSRLVEMLQTPGAIVVLDEINTLPPGVTKMLNPLLDYRRSLHLADGRVIKAHPSVLIVGAMNPQHYLGVKPLSQEVKSRARIEPIEYPPERTERGQYAPDEAMMLAKFVESLDELKQDEFARLWNYVANGDLASGGDQYKTPEREVDCKKLLHIVRTANRVREAYRAFRTGQSTDVIEFVFSQRETVEIATELSGSASVVAAIKEVVLPKISDPAERELVETIINNV